MAFESKIRREKVKELTLFGMDSLRISKLLRLSQRTVQRDLQKIRSERQHFSQEKQEEAICILNDGILHRKRLLYQLMNDSFCRTRDRIAICKELREEDKFKKDIWQMMKILPQEKSNICSKCKDNEDNEIIVTWKQERVAVDFPDWNKEEDAEVSVGV